MMKRRESNVMKDVSRRSFIKGSAAAAMTSLICVPRSVWADSTDNESPVVLRCAIMSDIHFFGKSDGEEVKRFRRAIASAYDYSETQKYDKLDGVMVVGDMTDNGNEVQLELFMKAVRETFKSETTLTPCMGNHEFWPGTRELWEEKLGVKSNARYEINGYQFIAISPEKGTMKEGDYLYIVDWLEKELDAANAADPNKPIFVFQHYPVSGTIYGSRGADNCGVTDLYETLCKYPNVVNFSGHSHFLMSDPRIVWQGNFTAFGTSSLSYIFLESFGNKYEVYPLNRYDYSEFYIMEVHADNSVTLMPYDNMTNSFYDFVYHIGAPNSDAPKPYTDKRYVDSEAPYWTEGAVLTTLETTEDRARIKIPTPLCRDRVHSYRLDIERLTEEGAIKEESQYCWSQYFDHPAPSSVDAILEGLEPATSYRVNAVALNPFMKPSKNKLALEFTTADEPDGLDRHKRDPDANLVDLRVVDGNIKNVARVADTNRKPCVVIGAPKTEYDEELKTDVIVCDGSKSFVKIPFNDNDYYRLRRPTVRAKVWIDGSRTSGSAVIFGCTEGRGVGLNVNYAEKTIGFIASTGGRHYRTAKGTVETNRWLDVVCLYDGLYQILYVDGKEVDRLTQRGFFSYPTDPAVQALCVGADIAQGGDGASFFHGKIANIRVYTWPLTQGQFC